MLLFMLWTYQSGCAVASILWKLIGVDGLESRLVTPPAERNTIGYERFTAARMGL
jgi:hypothetical protein